MGHAFCLHFQQPRKQQRQSPGYRVQHHTVSAARESYIRKMAAADAVNQANSDL
jgi:hypothetical protein